MIAWGQYIHWANIQYEQNSRIAEEDCHYSRLIGVGSHWLAAQYVVIEGWEQLKENDDDINQLLTEYQDFVSILRKCRNAVYHYQNKILDKRIQDALKEPELFYWAAALQDNFERFLYLYPFKTFGLCIESVDLHNDYFECIGWKPTDNVWVKWFDLYYLCLNYTKNNELNELDRTEENNLKVKQLFFSLIENKPHYLLQHLSRLKKEV